MAKPPLFQAPDKGFGSGPKPPVSRRGKGTLGIDTKKSKHLSLEEVIADPLTTAETLLALLAPWGMGVLTARTLRCIAFHPNATRDVYGVAALQLRYILRDHDAAIAWERDSAHVYPDLYRWIFGGWEHNPNAVLGDAPEETSDLLLAAAIWCLIRDEQNSDSFSRSESLVKLILRHGERVAPRLAVGEWLKQDTGKAIWPTHAFCVALLLHFHPEAHDREARLNDAIRGLSRIPNKVMASLLFLEASGVFPKIEPGLVEDLLDGNKDGGQFQFALAATLILTGERTVAGFRGADLVLAKVSTSFQWKLLHGWTAALHSMVGPDTFARLVRGLECDYRLILLTDRACPASLLLSETEYKKQSLQTCHELEGYSDSGYPRMMRQALEDLSRHRGSKTRPLFVSEDIFLHLLGHKDGRLRAAALVAGDSLEVLNGEEVAALLSEEQGAGTEAAPPYSTTPQKAYNLPTNP